VERIVFLDRESIEALIRAPAFAHDWRDHATTASEQVVARLREATIAITNKVPIREAALAQLPNLKMIAVCATGTDNVDVAWCRAHGIAVANIRNYAVHAVPEHVFMMILALRRNLIAYRDDVGRGLWQQAKQFCLFTQPIHDVYGSTMGIVGHGVLGQAVAQLARAFGMQVLIAEHKGASQVRAGYTAFDTVLRESDVLSLHSPLTPTTRNMIGRAELQAMRRHALLINAGRGGLIDEQALLEALEQSWIAGAGIDVLSQEPPREGNPLLSVQRANLIVTPHVAWASREAMQIMADQLIDNIEAFVTGRSQHLVT
jgi:glycerate dehydrogenase